jgi:hypothetical protein
LLKTSTCRAVKDDGQPCGAPRLRDSEFCFWHSPDHADELAEAQRLGGLRRRKERTVSGAYDLEGLDDVPKIRRLLEIAVTDTLSLENSIARSRTLAYLAQVALKTLEVGEFEARLEALEATMGPRLRTGTRR